MTGRLPFITITAFAMIACASAAFARAGKTPAAADNATIVRLEHQWLAAVSPGGDRDKLDAILANDYIDVDWQGRTRDKSALLNGATPNGVAERVTGMRVRVWDDTAVATGINHMHSSAKGWTVDVAFTDVFSRIDGHWRAVSSQETLRKPAQPSH